MNSIDRRLTGVTRYQQHPHPTDYSVNSHTAHSQSPVRQTSPNLPLYFVQGSLNLSDPSSHSIYPIFASFFPYVLSLPFSQVPRPIVGRGRAKVSFIGKFLLTVAVLSTTNFNYFIPSIRTTPPQPRAFPLWALVLFIPSEADC